MTAAALLVPAAAAPSGSESGPGRGARLTGVGAELGQHSTAAWRSTSTTPTRSSRLDQAHQARREGPAGANTRSRYRSLAPENGSTSWAGWNYTRPRDRSAHRDSAVKITRDHHDAGTAHSQPNMSPYVVRRVVQCICTPAMRWVRRGATAQSQTRRASAVFRTTPGQLQSMRLQARLSKRRRQGDFDEIPMGCRRPTCPTSRRSCSRQGHKPDLLYVSSRPATTRPRVKTYARLGMREAGINLIGPSTITDDTKLHAMCNARRAASPMHHFTRRSPTIRKQSLFVRPGRRIRRKLDAPNFFAVGGYDGMAAIVHVVRRLNGKIAVDKAAGGAKGWKFESPVATDHDRSGDAPTST